MLQSFALGRACKSPAGSPARTCEGRALHQGVLDAWHLSGSRRRAWALTCHEWDKMGQARLVGAGQDPLAASDIALHGLAGRSPQVTSLTASAPSCFVSHRKSGPFASECRASLPLWSEDSAPCLSSQVHENASRHYRTKTDAYNHCLLIRSSSFTKTTHLAKVFFMTSGHSHHLRRPPAARGHLWSRNGDVFLGAVKQSSRQGVELSGDLAAKGKKRSGFRLSLATRRCLVEVSSRAALRKHRDEEKIRCTRLARL